MTARLIFPDEELPDVAEAARAVAQEAKDVGLWVFGGGLMIHNEARTQTAAKARSGSRQLADLDSHGSLIITGSFSRLASRG